MIAFIAVAAAAVVIFAAVLSAEISVDARFQPIKPATLSHRATCRLPRFTRERKLGIPV